ncbi:putative alpha-galactosidase B [Triticum urartu]|uniref:Putative alpha-galactosidase B n=1 Tax=Triticum urartu TaxID=4572 RepID=M7YUK3_TRIUA|nr:putative alpha-galactosidase B [Triticum urartu]
MAGMLCVALLLTSLIWSAAPTAGSARDGRRQQLTALPPRGWNSYDSFSWIIDEAAFLDNARIMANRLLPHGYQYAVIDFLWYRRIAAGSGVGAYGFDSMDRWGRPYPDPRRFPSGRGGGGFRPIADKVHAMGLKFGIHLMNGISTQAVNANTPILDARTILKELERPVVLSISPGTAVTPALAENITQHVDMYRVTGDDWDSWKDVRPHFDVAR